ncbi:hypothetical protein Y032_0190g1234 [Ancylostoma ceylanicum]|uniref:Uncharacterized protein n=1 Tax=Ancylostoma ceylanicum TaxID=53326 RepID=A0A016SQX8_9BILA|nr:hypothetical protein Y032_0190g1234 [Ancylostoma ceylanicum]
MVEKQRRLRSGSGAQPGKNESRLMSKKGLQEGCSYFEQATVRSKYGLFPETYTAIPAPIEQSSECAFNRGAE